MSKIISYLCIFNMLIFSCLLPAMQSGRNNNRPSIPKEWLNKWRKAVFREARLGSIVSGPSVLGIARLRIGMHRAIRYVTRAKPSERCLEKRRFMDPMDSMDNSKIKTRTFRYKKLERVDWEAMRESFGAESSPEEGSATSSALENPAIPLAPEGGSTPPTDPVKRFFMQRITEFVKKPYGIAVAATTMVATAAITVVMFWPYLQCKSAQLYKKIVNFKPYLKWH